MAYFSSLRSAERYDRFRPKVHARALEWLKAATGPRRYASALDIGCGTGESTRPLQSIADFVEGVDTSAAMVAHAQSKGVQASLASYDHLPSRRYDLLTCCMAFHWFDRNRAIDAFARASANSAVWLIYNFAFKGHAGDDPFNQWLHSWYSAEFPSPVQAPQDFRVHNEDKGLVELAHMTGVMPIFFKRIDLIGYLTTQSNVEAKVLSGASYEDIERRIEASMPSTTTAEFEYAYSYTVASFSRR